MAKRTRLLIKSGHEFEKTVFSVSSAGFGERPPRIKFLPALCECLKNQPDGWDPLSPPTELGWQLLYSVARYLGGMRRRRARKVGLFSAIGSNLDVWRGIDGFFYTMPDGDWRRWVGQFTNSPESIFKPQSLVTIDLAIFWKLPEGLKADVLITPDLFTPARAQGLRSIGLEIACYLKGEIGVQELRGGRWPPTRSLPQAERETIITADTATTPSTVF